MGKRTTNRVALILAVLLMFGGLLACQVGKGAAPTVEITFPPTGRQVQVGAVVPVHAVARDDRGLARVELYSAGQVVQTTAASGPLYVAVQTWTAPQVGVFNVGVRAVDSDGQSSELAVVAIEVVASASQVSQPLPEAPQTPEGPVQTPGTEVQPPPPPEEQEPQPEGPSGEPGAPVDLEITNLTLSNVHPAPGEEIVVGVTIVNRGGTAAQDFHWAWNPGTGEDPTHSEAVASLAPGDDVVLEMRYAYQQPGQYSAEAWADSWDAFDEADETNNFAYEDVNVAARVENRAAAAVSFHDYQADGWATFRVDNTGTVALECVHAVINCGEGAFALHTEDRQPRPFLGGWSGRPPGEETLAAGQGAAMAFDIGEMVGSVPCEAEFTLFSQNGGQGLSTGAIPLEFTVEGAD